MYIYKSFNNCKTLPNNVLTITTVDLPFFNLVHPLTAGRRTTSTWYLVLIIFDIKFVIV